MARGNPWGVGGGVECLLSETKKSTNGKWQQMYWKISPGRRRGKTSSDDENAWGACCRGGGRTGRVGGGEKKATQTEARTGGRTVGQFVSYSRHDPGSQALRPPFWDGKNERKRSQRVSLATQNEEIGKEDNENKNRGRKGNSARLRKPRELRIIIMGTGVKRSIKEAASCDTKGKKKLKGKARGNGSNSSVTHNTIRSISERKQKGRKRI